MKADSQPGKMLLQNVWMSTWGTFGSSQQEPDLYWSRAACRLIPADLRNNSRQRSQSWAGTVSWWVSDWWMNISCFMNLPLFDLWSWGGFSRLIGLVCFLWFMWSGLCLCLFLFCACSSCGGFNTLSRLNAGICHFRQLESHMCHAAETLSFFADVMSIRSLGGCYFLRNVTLTLQLWCYRPFT